MQGPRALSSGDVLTFGPVVATYLEPAPAGPTDQLSTPPDQPRPVTFDIGGQRGGSISNVGRDQINVAARESALLHIAAARTRARRIIAAGFLLFAVGGGTYMWGILRFMAQMDKASQTDTQPQNVQLFGPTVGGFPLGLLGFALAALGSVLMTAGIVLHIVAAARRNRLNQAPFPQPPVRG